MIQPVVIVSAILIGGMCMHVALYGVRSAPRNRVTLSRTQWVRAALLLIVPVGGCLSMLIWQEQLHEVHDPEHLETAFVSLVLILPAMIFGMAPSYSEDG